MILHLEINLVGERIRRSKTAQKSSPPRVLIAASRRDLLVTGELPGSTWITG